MKLKISNDISLPIEAVTQTMAIIARKRVGKTYTASVVAEEMMKAKVPIVVLDPTGAWWGLRSSADGKQDGFPVVIIGGQHGDVPLEEHAGKIIADLVVDKPGFYIIDFSQIESDAAMHRIATDFGNRFYFKKEQNRFPMTLIVDEADMFMPQNPYDGEKKMLGIFDRICRRGGIRGVGMILISQRPAVLNKNVLTQCETLITLQISGSQDVDALAHWTKMHGSKEEREAYNSTIGSLQRGEAWIWSPSWLQVFKRIKIRERETFNSSATPKVGEKQITPEKMSQIDIARLGEQIKASAEKIKADDPATLKTRIRQLEAELKKQPVAKVEKSITSIKNVPTLTDAERKRLTKLIDSHEKLFQEVEKLNSSAIGLQGSIDTGKTEIRFFRDLLAGKLTTVERPDYSRPSAPARLAAYLKPKPLQRTVGSADTSNGEFKIGRCERSILTALAQYPQGGSANQVAILSGYSSGSGGFNNSLSGLRSHGLITRGNPMQVTQEGIAALGEYEPLPTGQDLIRYWLGKLDKCERSILECLSINYPNEMTSQEVAEKTGYTASSGGFNNALSRLRTLELITRGQPMKASDEFFQ